MNGEIGEDEGPDDDVRDTDSSELLLQLDESRTQDVGSVDHGMENRSRI